MALLSALGFSVLLIQHVGLCVSAGSETVSCLPGSPGHNGFPGRDGRDGLPGPKGDKGELGLSVQGPPGKAGPEGPIGPAGSKGQKGEPGDLLVKILQQEINQIREQLRSLLQHKVAFSASLSTLTAGSRNIGPYPESQTLVYENALTNIGNAYNPNTGIFTAPVKGVYYFSFVLFNPYSVSTGLTLMKNEGMVVSVTDNPPGNDTEDTACNSVSLLLEKGDRVYLELMENRKVYTDVWRRNTFSGHLLFTM